MSFADSTGLSMCHIHSPSIIFLGSLWVCFILGCSFIEQNIFFLWCLCTCFNFLSFTFCHLKREIFSKPLCLVGLSVPQESQDPCATKSSSCPGHPSLGVPWTRGWFQCPEGHTVPDPCPSSPQLCFTHCRHWWCP